MNSTPTPEREGWACVGGSYFKCWYHDIAPWYEALGTTGPLTHTAAKGRACRGSRL